MFDLDRVRASWQRESAAIDAAIAKLTNTTAQQPMRDDGWTAQDILGHITNATRALVRQLQSDTAFPPNTPFDVDALNAQQRERNRARPWPEVRGYWQRTRDEVTALLRSCPADIGERPAHVPWLPQVQTAGDVLRVLILHTRSHREELEQERSKVERLERSDV